MQMSRTETEFLHSCKYDVYTRGALIAGAAGFSEWNYALRVTIRGRISACIYKKFGDSIKSLLCNYFS